MQLSELLEIRNIKNRSEIKLVRHIAGKHNLKEIYETIGLDLYQEFQSKPVFNNCKYIISFLGIEGTLSRLIGIYKVEGYKIVKKSALPIDYPYPEVLAGAKFRYTLTPVPLLDDLKDRLVIDWGGGVMTWHQWFADRQIVEILPTGYVKDFPGYENILLSHRQLKTIVDNPIANREWHSRLSSISGIYLITNTKTGQLYVGSASGKEGILGRWRTYAKNGHGDNDVLIKAMSESLTFLQDIQFSIIKVMSNSMIKKEIVATEYLMMKKLGSRAHGLNHASGLTIPSTPPASPARTQ